MCSRIADGLNSQLPREIPLMRTLLTWIGRLTGALGIVTIIAALAARLAGAYWLGGYQVGTILQAGMACVLLACLGYTAVLVEWPRRLDD